MSYKFIDIHCHSVSQHSRNGTNIYLKIRRDITGFLKFVMGDENIRSNNTQSDFPHLHEGDVEAIMISFYPTEKGWFLPKKAFYSKDLIFFLLRSVLKNMSYQEFRKKLLTEATGFDEGYINRVINGIESGTIDYFTELQDEYNYTKVNTGEYQNKKFEVVSDYNQFIALQNNRSANVAVNVGIILSVEGGHSFGSGYPKSLLFEKPENITERHYIDYFRNNLFSVKKWSSVNSNDHKHCPFYLTLGHHYWNMLCGHSESLPDLIFNQHQGKETGITKAGWAFLKDCIGNHDEQGNPNTLRRILIDVKHMSPKSRKEYYEYLETNQIKIPIICSHTSIGCAQTCESYLDERNTLGQRINISNIEYDNWFNSTSLSLNKEDVSKIAASDGIIGIILSEARIANKKAFKLSNIKKWRRDRKRLINKIAKLKDESTSPRRERKIQQLEKELDNVEWLLRREYINFIMANVYQIVETISLDRTTQLGKQKAWNYMCIGSDFDGTINKLDLFGESNTFSVMANQIEVFLDNPRDLVNFNSAWNGNYLRSLSFNLSSTDITERIMSKNVEKFLEKYFNEDFLIRDIQPDDALLNTE